MAKTDPIDPNVPAGTEDPKLGDNRIRELAKAVAEILGVDHYIGADGGAGTGYNEDAAGEHSKVKFNAPLGADPSNAANKGFLYTKDVSGKVELFWEDEDGDVVQLTVAGVFNIALLTSKTITTPTLTSPVLNTGVSGTAVLDEDDMASDSATKLATQQSIKKYVDDSVKGNAPTINDSESNAMLKAHAYLAQTAGFINAYGTTTNYAELNLYIGATDDPAGAGTNVDKDEQNTATDMVHVRGFVPKGMYFEITTADTLDAIVWTPLISGGGAPIDQD